LYSTKQPFLLDKTAVFQRIRSENLYKISEMINVQILCSNCPLPAATHARSLFRHSSTALSIMGSTASEHRRCQHCRQSMKSLSHSSAIQRFSKNIKKLSKYHLSQASFLLNSLVYLLLKLVHKVKCYCRNTKGSQFYETHCGGRPLLSDVSPARQDLLTTPNANDTVVQCSRLDK